MQYLASIKIDFYTKNIFYTIKKHYVFINSINEQIEKVHKILINILMICT